MITHEDGSMTTIAFENFHGEDPIGEGWLRLTEANIRARRFGHHTEEAKRALASWEKYLRNNPQAGGEPYARIELVAEPTLG